MMGTDESGNIGEWKGERRKAPPPEPERTELGRRCVQVITKDPRGRAEHFL
jgi:hypothetical protein